MSIVSLKYALSENVFPSKSAFAEAIKQVKSKCIKIDELQADISNQILSFYSSIYDHFNGFNLQENDIIYRESVHAFIDSFNIPMYWTFFSVLKNNGLIGVCCRGYTFDYKPTEQNNKAIYNKQMKELQRIYEHVKNNNDKKSMSDIFMKMSNLEKEYFNNKQVETPKETNNSDVSYIAYNRTFPDYEEAYNYCIQLDFDPEHIETVSAASSQNETFHLYNRTFRSYRDAYNYAIANKIKLSMIISDNLIVSNERLQAIEWQYITSKYAMSYDDVNDFLSHLQTVPNNIYVDKRISDCRSLLQRHETIQANKIGHELKQVKMFEHANNLIVDMCNKGLQRKETPYSVKYLYNDEVVISFTSGLTIENMHNSVCKVYEQYFIPAKLHI